MLRWKYIFFDLDNTLYSHEYAFEKAIQACYQELLEEWEVKGVDVPYVPMEDWFDVFKYFSDCYWPEYEKKAISQQAYRRKRYNATMSHFKLPHSDQEADHFHEKYYEKAHIYVQPYPYLYPLLQDLVQQGICVGVITNGRNQVQWLKYNKLKLFRYIPKDCFIVSEDVGVEKPSKDIFNLVFKQVKDMDQAIFIGDAWEMDVVGALEAGWDAIYLNTQYRPRTTSHKPLIEVHTLKEIYTFFHVSD